jgi:hypothetical protein
MAYHPIVNSQVVHPWCPLLLNIVLKPRAYLAPVKHIVEEWHPWVVGQVHNDAEL